MSILNSIKPAKITRFTREFRKNTNGLAAVEFALIAPIMVFMFFATVEGSNALSMSRRVALSVNTLSDLVSQETEVNANQLSDLFIGMEDIITQSNITVTFRVVSLIVDPATDDVIVHWSHDNSGNEPYTAGTKYTGPADVTLLDSTASMVVSEVSYTYTPPLTHMLISTVNFDKTAARWPRRALRVQYCTGPDNCTT